MDVEHMSIRFYQKLEADSHIKVAYATELISREKCDATIARLLEIYANPSVKKTPNDYYVLRKYDVVNHEGGRALVAKGTQKRFVCHEDLFNELLQVHLAAGHPGARMLHRQFIRHRFANISERHGRVLVHICGPCQLKRAHRGDRNKRAKQKYDDDDDAEDDEQEQQEEVVTPAPPQPSSSSKTPSFADDSGSSCFQANLNDTMEDCTTNAVKRSRYARDFGGPAASAHFSRVSGPPVKKCSSSTDFGCLLDFIDMSREPEAGFHHILFYEDDDTRFVLLRPLAGTSKCPKEVAKHLVEIFCAIGAPATVRCAESGDFTSKLFDQLVRRWPECQAIRVVAVGGGQHSNDRSKTEVRKRLACWKIDNNNALAWPDGLPLVQWSVNTKFHTELRSSPYRAMFGREPAGARLKVLTTLLPDEGKEEEEAHNQVVVGDHNEVGGEEQGVHLEMGSDEKVTNGGGGYNLLMGMGNSHQPLDDSLLISGGMLATGGGQQSSSSAKHLYSFY